MKKHTSTFVFILLFAIYNSLSNISDLFCQVKQEWVQRFNDFGHHDAEITCMTIDNHDNIYVAGYTYIDNVHQRDYLVIKYDTKGKKLWSQTYDGPGHVYDCVTAIALDKKGNVVVTGESKGDGTDLDFATIKYDSNGKQQWIRRYDGESKGSDSPTSIATDKSNDVYVAGYENYNESYDKCDAYTIIKYDSDGNVIWSKRFSNSIRGFGREVFMSVDDSQNPYLAGTIRELNGDRANLTVKYDKSGDTLWTRKSEGWQVIVADAFSVSKEGMSYAVGHVPMSWFTYVWLSKYDANGSSLFESALISNDNFVIIKNIHLDKNNNLYLTGTEQKRGARRDIITREYNSDLSLKWKAVYNGDSNKDDESRAIIIDNNSNTYITGRSVVNSSQTDIITLKYDSLGTPIWRVRYTGPASLEGTGIAILIDSKRSIIVGGKTEAEDGTSDITVIKYTQENNKK